MARKETAAESPQMEEIVDAVKQISQPLQTEGVASLPKPTPAEVPAPAVTKYASNYYKAAKIPHCSECGEKRRTGTDGKQFCPAQNPNCSFIK